MRGKITKTEKILAGCTVVFLLAVCGFCFSEIAAGGNGVWSVETDRTAAAEAVIPPEAGLININTAPVELLTELPGIGSKLAERIVSHRESNGPFRYKSQLLEVSGIGAGTYRGLEDLITVEEGDA